MNNLDKTYLNLCQEILNTGIRKENRTGVDTIATSGLSIRHDMSTGFPLLTTKKVAYKSVKVELEGFIKGITSKKWYQERGCKIWNEWCNPQKVPYGNDDETKQKMLEEDDLGNIYGAQWRDFHDPDASYADANSRFKSGDQLQNIVDTLKNNPNDRRMVCSAWNPNALHTMALPPCHFSWQVLKVGDRLDLIWNQRSCDFFLGIPFNIASYGTLLHLLAKEANLKEGILTGHFGDCHLYENSIDAIKTQSQREPYDLPRIETDNFTNVFDWEYKDTKLIDYNSHETIKVEVAV
jgi:thymidylate synthase